MRLPELPRSGRRDHRGLLISPLSVIFLTEIRRRFLFKSACSSGLQVQDCGLARGAASGSVRRSSPSSTKCFFQIAVALF
jgi:hypothetical protein